MSSYRTLCTRFYDLDKPEAPDVGLRFYLPRIERAEGPVIELMCGSGRYLEPFLATGHDVDGTDASADMLAACRRRIGTRWPAAGIFHQDIELLNLPRPYGLAIVTSGSFSLLTDPQGTKRALGRIFNALSPGGSFVGEIQGFDPDQTSASTTDIRRVSTRDGGEIVLTSVTSYDASSGLEQTRSEYVLMEKGRPVGVEHEELGLRYYRQGQFANLLNDAGFAEIGFSGAYPDTALADMGGILLFECKRPRLL